MSKNNQWVGWLSLTSSTIVLIVGVVVFYFTDTNNIKSENNEDIKDLQRRVIILETNYKRYEGFNPELFNYQVKVTDEKINKILYLVDPTYNSISSGHHRGSKPR